MDDYKDMGGKIKFYRESGEIELDKAIIKDIKKTKAIKRTEDSAPSETTKDTPEKPSAEKSSQPQKQEIDSKLKEIAGKKAQLRAEGEKLIADKKKLEEEIKKKGQALYIREEREYKRRISELEEKIKKVNEEISSADKEEAMLLKRSRRALKVYLPPCSQFKYKTLKRLSAVVIRNNNSNLCFPLEICRDNPLNQACCFSIVMPEGAVLRE